MEKTPVLVVGFGSIGQRHAEILASLGCIVSLVSNQSIKEYPTFKNLTEAFSQSSFEYVVIANETSKHLESLKELARENFSGTVLVEKPLFISFDEIPKNKFKNIFVGYNLRFHPLVQKTKSLLEGSTYSVQAYVGQYLPDWRPGTDYKQSYSADSKKGGGVIRDLSHELDLLLWLFGDWSKLSSISGKYSKLDINSEDIVAVLMEMESAPVVSLEMNYLARVPRRQIVINTEENLIVLDLINSTLSVNEEIESFSEERNFTYTAQHQAILSHEHDFLCSANNGTKVNKLIDAIEVSSNNQKWQQN